MNTQDFYEIVEREITNQLDSIGPRPTPHRVRHALEHVAQIAFRQGQQAALMTLSTSDDVATLYGVSTRSIRERAKRLHDRWGLGWQVPGTGQWLFTPDEVECLRPDERFRPKSLDA